MFHNDDLVSKGVLDFQNIGFCIICIPLNRWHIDFCKLVCEIYEAFVLFVDS